MIKKWLAICTIMFVCLSTVNAFAAASTDSLLKSQHDENDFEGLGAVTMKTEHEVYGTDMTAITLLVTNNSQEAINFGLDYEMEAYNGGLWYSIPSNMIFGEVEIPLSAGGIHSKVITLQHDAFKFSQGQYRIVKNIDGKLYQTKFKLGKSAYTAATPYGFVAMEKLPSNYTRREAATAGDVVITPEGVIGNDVYVKFLENVNMGVPSMLRITNVENVHSPKVMDIIYNEYFLVREGKLAKLGSKDEDENIEETVYSYLNSESSIVYFSNYASTTLSTVYKNTDKIKIPLLNESSEGKQAAIKINEAMKKRTAENEITFKIYSPDRLLNVTMEKSPLKFGISSKNSEQTIDLTDEKGIATKIVDITWINNKRFMINCETSEDKKYFAVFEMQLSRPVLVFSEYSEIAPTHTINMNLTNN